MAISLVRETPHGLRLASAYHRIAFVRLVAPDDLLIQLAIYPTEADRRADRQPVDQVTVTLIASEVVTTGTLVASLYATLKTLPEYADAIDV
jgi:hypothetical protein